MSRKPPRLKTEMEYNEGLWQEGFFEFGGHPPIQKHKRGRPRLTPEQREVSNLRQKEYQKEYQRKYYLSVTKPKRRRT